MFCMHQTVERKCVQPNFRVPSLKKPQLTASTMANLNVLTCYTLSLPFIFVKGSSSSSSDNYSRSSSDNSDSDSTKKESSSSDKSSSKSSIFSTTSAVTITSTSTTTTTTLSPSKAHNPYNDEDSYDSSDITNDNDPTKASSDFSQIDTTPNPNDAIIPSLTETITTTNIMNINGNLDSMMSTTTAMSQTTSQQSLSTSSTIDTTQQTEIDCTENIGTRSCQCFNSQNCQQIEDETGRCIWNEIDNQCRQSLQINNINAAQSISNESVIFGTVNIPIIAIIGALTFLLLILLIICGWFICHKQRKKTVTHELIGGKSMSYDHNQGQDVDTDGGEISSIVQESSSDDNCGEHDVISPIISDGNNNYANTNDEALGILVGDGDGVENTGYCN